MNKTTLPWLLLTLLLAGRVLAAGPVQAQAGRFTVQVVTHPAPPIAGENLFVITVRDGGKPLARAGINVHVDMLDMPMPADFTAVPGAEAGEYRATVNLSMAGKWRVQVAVQQMAGMDMAGDGTAHFLLDTGKTFVPAGSRRLRWWHLLGAVVLAAGIMLLVRYRYRPQVRGVVAGLLTLAMVLAITVYMVRRYRDPTVTTVVASATMDMSSMQAAPGTVPVEVETVSRAPFQLQVTYTGTVVPDVEEEVLPRVGGLVTYLPFYPGDHVQRGQVVARLQARELAESAAGAAGEVEAAAAELRRARRAADQEGSAATAAAAALEQAREGVAQATAERDTAQAEVTLAQAEIGRAQRLFDMGAISRAELDRRTAQARTATARLAQAEAGVRAARAGVARAEGELAAGQASRDAAQSAIAAAAGRLRAAQGRRGETGTLHGYTELRAGNSGVVTARYVVPGVVVQPGTPLLRLAKLDYVRLQASVAESDLSRLRLGSRLTAFTVDRPNAPIVGTISAIFPARDAATRTAVVEARVPNPGQLLQPGQYLSVSLAVGNDRAEAITVPNSALVQRDGQTWVFAVASEGRRTIARRMPVTTGLMGNHRTQVLTGLQPGDRVVVRGQADLREGDAVTVLREADTRSPAARGHEQA